MNDISYHPSYSDAAILREIGEFVKAKRIDHNLTQDEVAERAAISRSTLSLTERGENIGLINLLKVLRVLDALYVFDLFKVEPKISPMLLAKEDEKKRKRASKSNPQITKDDLGW
ncbi:helix-turn-helix domain-containing protein [Sphingobacterium sp. SRCM116780]|uniref:helix-turn-helix domain-containing protein n=1 Tax=Sphingobacterium sp. SRCM116780 TaxID=2907623 RepID=UPI001F29B4F7|nr:helix-turn-helix transcriptional regulator [Sphingobacterium sp. SRCM116780]UIR56344.1 helix-turn-helix domain-containing protein [Sphingobacterium sp. SRCM116780]